MPHRFLVSAILCFASSGLTHGVMAAPQLQVQLSESGCSAACPAAIAFNDAGSGILSFTPKTFGDFRITSFSVLGLESNPDFVDVPQTILLPTGSFLSHYASAALTIKITETGLVAINSPITFDFSPSVTLAKHSNLRISTYVDPSDVAFGTSNTVALTPTSSLATANADGSVAFVNHLNIQSSSGADSGDVPLVMSAAGDFSITEILTYQGSLSSSTSIGGTFTADPPVYTPEPASLTLFATVMAGLAAVKRRNRLAFGTSHAKRAR